jgi:hypothetical protein
MSDSEEFTTTDFYTAALLVHSEYEIRGVTREGPEDKRDGLGKTRRFHFTNSEELSREILDFRNGKKTGSLKKFKEAIETIKDLVHS